MLNQTGIPSEAANVAVYMDWENLFMSAKAINTFPNVGNVMEHASAIGRVVDAHAYGDFNGDWYRYYRIPFLEHGVRQIHLAHTSSYSQKNRADILLAIDAMECALTVPFIDTFFIGSGDSDLSELVVALRAKGKSVVLAAYRHATSPFVTRLADMFIDLTPETEDLTSNDAAIAAEAILREAMEAARTCGKSRIAAASLKPLIQERAPSFNEQALGYQNFKAFLEAHPGVAPVSWQETAGGVPQLFVELQTPCAKLVPAA